MRKKQLQIGEDFDIFHSALKKKIADAV